MIRLVGFSILTILATPRDTNAWEYVLPMAKPPSDTRLQNYPKEVERNTALELASKYQTSLARVWGDLSRLNLKFPHEPMEFRRGFYKSNHRNKDFVAIAHELGLSPSQVLYELKYLNLAVQYPDLDVLSDDATNTTAWKVFINYRSEKRRRDELMIELAYFGYDAEEIEQILNAEHPKLHPLHLIMPMIQDRLSQFDIPQREIAPANLKSSVSLASSKLDRENHVIRKVLEYLKREKRLPQESDFMPELSHRAENKVGVRFSEFVLPFGSISQALVQTKKRSFEFSQSMGKLPTFKLLEWDWQANPGQESRNLMKEEVIETFKAHLAPSSNELPSEEKISEWLGVPFEAVVASGEYAPSQERYPLRIFENSTEFEGRLKMHFPNIRFSKPVTAENPELKDKN